MQDLCGLLPWPRPASSSLFPPLSPAERIKLILTWLCSFWLAAATFWPLATLTTNVTSQWSCYLLVAPLQHILNDDDDVDTIEWWQCTASARFLQLNINDRHNPQDAHHYLCIRMKDGKGIVIDASGAHSSFKNIIVDEDIYLQHSIKFDSDHKKLVIEEAKAEQERGKSNYNNPPVCMTEVAEETLHDWEEQWMKEGKTWKTLCDCPARERKNMFDDLVRKMRVGMIWKLDDVRAEEDYGEMCRDRVSRWLNSVE
ncbi:hypothetical protein BDV96DRAFT_601401 [Lophiotrema nucula]|uniref:Uncharacterized protein n=1 Tax=Lophiotrema nucula TaxID=690887 RepID=A0A6A5Z2D2_9PLEO|nr:hypothetical protein BDV96DRAFT_601401 [Lophiotrema nucula]